MNRQHYGWWNYVRHMIRQHSERISRILRGPKLSEIERSEYNAVQSAIEQTERMTDGEKRLSVIGRVLMHRTHTISGAAILVPRSERTAQRWCSEFIKLVAKNFSCDGLI